MCRKSQKCTDLSIRNSADSPDRGKPGALGEAAFVIFWTRVRARGRGCSPAHPLFVRPPRAKASIVHRRERGATQRTPRLCVSQPFCPSPRISESSYERKGPGCTGLAEIADHYIPAVVFIELCREKRKFLIATEAFFYMSNLQSLCWPCHAVKSDEDTARIARGGPWTELDRPAKKWAF